MSHTPGKWHIMEGGFSLKSKIGNPNLIQIYATNDDLEMICQVWRDGMLVSKVQDFKSNARLIAASPEMYSLIESLASGFTEGAIEKARMIKESILQDNDSEN